MAEPDNQEFRIDGFGPLGIASPLAVSDVCEMVRKAAAEDHAIYPVGGRTMLDLGLPPTKPGIAIDVTALNQVIDYPARDMTITVQAGIAIARLQEILAVENQRLPIDVPLPERATLGGAVACNVSGPRRYSFGTLRDYVIGISVVNAQGQVVKAGGRVVKNVAGYDLCKLYTGSLGTLGIITELTLKVRPKPEAQAMLITGCPEDALADVLARLHGSSTRPVCIEVLTPTPRHGADFDVLVGFEDNREAVAWQADRLQQELGPAHPCLVLVHRDEQAERGFRLLGEGSPPAGTPITFKANLLSSAVVDFLRLVRGFPFNFVQAHAGNGIVIGHLPKDVTLDQARDTIHRLRAAAVEARGNLVLTRCLTTWKKTLGVWGQPRGDWALMRTIKDQLDPKHLFNPGRFVEGI